MINKDLFIPLNQEIISVQQTTKPLGYWQDAWRRLKQNKIALGGLILIICLIVIAILGPIFSTHTYDEQNLMLTNSPPSLDHWFGTDNLGRDIFIRVLYGARISLAIGIVASLLNLFIGVIYGGIAGFCGGKIDRIMMNIVDVLYSVPTLLYVILLMVILKPGLINIFIALGIGYWLQMARIVRGQILAMKEYEFILVAKTIGISKSRILLRHLLPNTMGTIIVTMTLAIPDAIFTEAFLSFIGLGVSAPMASWGVLASEGINNIRAYPFQLFFPATAISITMLAFNFLGDGLRDVLDPKMRR